MSKPKKYKISFCVVCMNRLHQLKQTLLKNIVDNKTYNKLEFIILDYNSQDGMEDWAKENLSEYIISGKVIYYKTTDPKSWSPSHSKNLAFKLATGDIVCSIWADYFTGVDFASYVNAQFKQDQNIVLTPIDFHKKKIAYHPPGDVFGKVCVKKSDFIKINGFDERMNKHGFEDYDFINRLEMTGVNRILIEDKNYLKYISHNNDERYTLPIDNLQGLYINYIEPFLSEVLFLYDDSTFKKGLLIDKYVILSDSPTKAYEPEKNHFEYSLKPPGWEEGKWNKEGKTIITSQLLIIDKTESHKQYEIQNNILVDIETGIYFYEITNTDLINDILVFDHYYYTRRIMEENLKNNKVIVNYNDFGKATVYKNFQNDFPVTI